MADQRELFAGAALDAWAPGQRPARARRTDPESSHRAADDFEARGAAESWVRAALEAVERLPGGTTRELAALDAVGADAISARTHALGRRLSDLNRRGLIVRTRLGAADSRLWPRGVSIPHGVGEVDAQ